MKREFGANELQKPRICIAHRLLAMLLCIIMVSSMCDTAIFSHAQASEPSGPYISSEETQEDLKTSLMNRIIRGDFDPYSADMTLEEFYALMELFEDGSLPLESEDPQNSPSGSMKIKAPGTAVRKADDDEEEEVYIARSMFMFRGLTDYDGDNKPLEYDDEFGSDEEDYPPGLDPYHINYMRPPKTWQGVLTSDEKKPMSSCRIRMTVTRPLQETWIRICLYITMATMCAKYRFRIPMSLFLARSSCRDRANMYTTI